MAKWRRTERGTVRGRCRSCRATADLTLVEMRYEKQVRDLFRRDFDHRVDRRLKCSACAQAYPVATGDLAAFAVPADDERTAAPDVARRTG